MTSLLEHGPFTRGYLGVTIQEVTPPLAKAIGLPSTDGVLISDVEPISPGAKAGLRRGDVVLSVDGQVVRSTEELRNVVAGVPVGKKVEVVVTRGGGRRETVRVRVAEMPGPPSVRPAAVASPGAGEAGLMIAPLDDVARRRLQVPTNIKQGVVVNAVRPSSPAARAGLRPGDVVLETGRNTIGSPEQFSALWAKSKGTTALFVWREGRTLYVAITR